MVSVIIAILVFGLIIFIHELGHFIVAKLSDVRVNEFALGMGPKLIKKQKGETLYSLRLFPIGGFCSMEGENDSSDNDRALCNKKVSRRIAIVVAGAIMNLILGFLFLMVMSATQPQYASTQISWFEDNALSQSTGLEIGDYIKKVNNFSIMTTSDLSYQLRSDKDGVFDMVVERDGKDIELKNVKFKMETVNNDDGETSHNLHIDFKVSPIERGVGTAITNSAKTSVSYARLVWVSLGDLITGQYNFSDLSGPVGIVSSINDVVESETTDTGIDWQALFEKILSMGALISINVGIFNLLPLPALDGGRLVFLIIEGIRRKPINPEKEGMVHFIGLALLMLLMIAVTLNDIGKLF